MNDTDNIYQLISDALSAVDDGAYRARQAGRNDIANLLDDAFAALDKAERKL